MSVTEPSTARSNDSAGDSKAAQSQQSDPAGVAADLENALQTCRAAFDRNRDPSYQQRRDWLKTLRRVLLDNKQRFVDAISSDFGNRSPHETLGAEVLVADSGIKYLLHHLKDWMQPEPRHTALTFAPAKVEVRYQPKGVVGVISPWNYPLQLAIVPIATALAAGNRVLLKPSELTPATSDLMAELFHAAFPEDLVRVLTGGPDVGAAFSSLRFDHLVYTGSTHVGRLVMKAAAENLVPVTLELGGKSPAIVHPGASFDQAVERIAFGKVLNAGQTCVATDYVLVPRQMEDKLVSALQDQIRSFLPTLRDNRDYTSLVNDRHHARVQSLIDDAVEKGAKATVVNAANDDLSGTRKIAPTILQNVSDDMTVMQDEIFGPVLPIVPYDSLDDAIRYVNDRPRPLALYYFDTNAGRIDKVIRQTHSGGVGINEVALHVAQDDLPFGGIGPSGMGAYHGREGFVSLSHAKAVMHQRRVRFVQLFNPPYGRAVETVLKVLVR